MEAIYEWVSSERSVLVKEVCWTVVLTVVCSVMMMLFHKVWLRPQRIRSVLHKQGINGPKPSFPFGNISEMQSIHHQPSPDSDSVDSLDNWVSSIFPYFHTWKQRYGMSQIELIVLLIVLIAVGILITNRFIYFQC